MDTPIETPPEIQDAVDKVAEAKLAEIKAMTLVMRLWHIQTELGRVAKQGRNEAQKYKYLRESDLVAAITELATKYRVSIVFQQDVTRTLIDTSLQSANGKPMTGTLVTQGYEIYSIDDPEDKLSKIMGPLFSQGYSADSGDKSLYKAKTGAKKYALTDTFMVASGDDAETDGLSDEREPQQQRSNARSDGGPATDDQVKLWAARQKEWGVKPSVAIGSIGKAINRSLNLKPSQVKDFLRSLSKRDMDRALAELVKVKPLPPAAPPAPAAEPPPRVPSA